MRFFLVLVSMLLLACGPSVDTPEEEAESASSENESIVEELADSTRNTNALSADKKKNAVDTSLSWVYIDNAAVQCEFNGKALSETRHQLEHAGVQVAESQCAVITGVMSAALCGLKDFSIHMHQVANKDLKKARSLGFEPIESLRHHGDKSYKKMACP